MELIKKLKQTEAQAKELVEQARAEAARMAQEGRNTRTDALHQAEQQRRQDIDEAVAAAKAQAAIDVEAMKADAEKGRQKLREQTKGKLDEAVHKVTDYLKG